MKLICRLSSHFPESGSYRLRYFSLINDLAAIIAACDPAECRTKSFRIDRGHKRLELVAFSSTRDSRAT